MADDVVKLDPDAFMAAKIILIDCSEDGCNQVHLAMADRENVVRAVAHMPLATALCIASKIAQAGSEIAAGLGMKIDGESSHDAMGETKGTA